MTEAEWLACNDPEEMYFQVVNPLKSSQRRMDMFCLACARAVLHLIENEDATRAFEWLEEHPGQRHLPKSGEGVWQLFQGHARGLYDAHHQRASGVGGRAVHVAYDLWADWYEYAFPNLCELFTAYPTPSAKDPHIYLPAIMRDIFGNPFQHATINPMWLTWNGGTVCRIAQAIYDDRAFDRMPILADALEDAGCDNADILTHCRSGSSDACAAAG